MKKSEEYYREKEVCWIKLKGYPWWPGIINKIINKNQKLVYEVIYLGEKDKLNISQGFMKKWKDNYDKYKLCFDSGRKIEKKIRTSFDCALKVAELLIEQKITIDETFSFPKHFQIIKRKRNKESIIKYINDINANQTDNKVNNKIITDDFDINLNNEINNIHDDINNNNFELEHNYNNKVRINIEFLKDDIKDIKKNGIKDKENQNCSFKKKFRRSKSVKKFLKRKRKHHNLDFENKKEEDITKENEISMNPAELNKMKNLINTITNNIDQILEKSDKYQNYLKNEFSKIKFDSKDSRQINFKIGLISYVKTMSELLNIPIALNKYIQVMNSKKI